MLRDLVHRSGPAAVLVLALALTPAALVAAPVAPDTPDKDKDAGPAAKIKKQLDQTLNLEVTEQSLNSAINQIREQTKINFVVDRLSIQQMGMDPEQILVSVKLKDVKARTALRAVLGPYNLGYAIIGDTVLVSTDDMAMYRQLHQRVNLDLEKVSLADALKKLSRETAANLMLDPRVAAKEAKAEVNLQMEDVPLETAVRLMSEMAGLKPVRVGNVLFVTTKNHANEIRADEQMQQGMPGQPGVMIEPGGVPQQQPQPGVPGGSTTLPPLPDKPEPDNPGKKDRDIDSPPPAKPADDKPQPKTEKADGKDGDKADKPRDRDEPAPPAKPEKP